MNHERFMKLAQHVACWSKDPSTKIGCVIVNPLRIVVAMGFNGFPRGVDDDPERYANRELKYKIVQHAEANAIFNASASVKGCALYSTHPPCCNCTGAIIQAGVEKVYTIGTDRQWLDDSRETSRMMFEESGVGYWEMHPETFKVLEQ